MSPFQRGRAAHAADVCRFDNPHSMGSVEFSDWRRGWDYAANEQRISRDPADDIFGRLARRGTSPIDGRTYNLGSN